MTVLMVQSNGKRVRIDSNGSILTATLGTDNVHLGEGAGASIASGGNQNVHW